MNDLFGFHFIEPIVSLNEVQKVRPKVRGQFKPKAEALNYMKKVEKKQKIIAINDQGKMDAQEKRQFA